MKSKTLEVVATFPEINAIQDLKLRQKVVQVWERLWAEGSWSRIEDLPVSPKLAYPHVRHNRAVAQLALAMARVLQEVHGVHVNTDLLVAAAFLQDVSKLVEYAPQPDGTVERTEIGHKLGHATYAAHAALQVGMPLDLVNVILSHSPDSALAWGSLEARLLYYADQVDVAALGGDRFQKKVVQYR